MNVRKILAPLTNVLADEVELPGVGAIRVFDEILVSGYSCSHGRTFDRLAGKVATVSASQGAIKLWAEASPYIDVEKVWMDFGAITAVELVHRELA